MSSCTCFDKIVKAGAFDMLKLIDSTVEVYGVSSSRLSVKASESLWIADSVDGSKLLRVDLKFEALR